MNTLQQDLIRAFQENNPMAAMDALNQLIVELMKGSNSSISRHDISHINKAAVSLVGKFQQNKRADYWTFIGDVVQCLTEHQYFLSQFGFLGVCSKTPLQCFLRNTELISTYCRWRCCWPESAPELVEQFQQKGFEHFVPFGNRL